MTVKAAAVLAQAETQLGKPYRVTGCRCEQSCYAHDCSGLIVSSTNAAAGFNLLPCTSSFGLARLGRDAGLLISEAKALVTPAALLIRNGFGSPNGPNGSNGHVVFSKGDGHSTVEAMGTRYGIVRGPAQGRGFETFMLIPGVDYSTEPPWKVQPMFAPALDVRAVLNDPGKGAWLGVSDGTVYYSGPSNSVVVGGMTKDPEDAAAFKGRTLAKLNARKRANGDNGYEIVATTGEKYIPSAQH